MLVLPINISIYISCQIWDLKHLKDYSAPELCLFQDITQKCGVLKTFNHQTVFRREQLDFTLVCTGLLLYLHLGVRLGGVKQEVIDGSV